MNARLREGLRKTMARVMTAVQWLDGDGRRPRPAVFGLSRRISGECLERLALLAFNFSMPLEICDLISGLAAIWSPKFRNKTITACLFSRIKYLLSLWPADVCN